MLRAGIVESLNLLAESREELIRVGDLYDFRAPELCYSFRVVHERRTSSPVRCKPTRSAAFERVAQCDIPLCRPAANNEPIFVQNPIEKCVQFRVILREFFRCV